MEARGRVPATDRAPCERRRRGILSAEGAIYDSQGKREARRPGTQPIKPRALKGAKYAAQYFGLSGLNAAY